jgi:signal transduction histidine kinase
MRQFSAAMAHELRTPLAAMRGEIEWALTCARSPQQYQRGLTSQLEELDRLARLINQLLTLSRAEAGEISLARVPVNLAALSGSVVDALEPVALAAGVALACEIPEDAIVIGDAGWLERLLLNLLDNAIKFTPPGGRILVRVAREQHGVRLDVRDTGIGIPPGALPHIFERFYRADASRSPQAEGAGLGLSLARWIADRHGATIAVESRPGEGSTFTLRLPIAASMRSAS